MVLVLVPCARGRWRGGTTTGVGPRLAGWGVALAYCGVVGSVLGCIAFLGPGFSDGLRLGQVGQPLVAKGQCSGDDQPLGHLRLLGVRGESEPRVDLSAQLAVEFEQTLGTHRTALGGIGVDCGAVQPDVSQGQHPHFLGGQADVDKEIFQCWKKGFTKGGNGVMIRMEAARKDVERHRRVGRPFNLAGTEGACGVAIQQQTSKNFWRDGLATAWTIVGVESTQVQWRDHVDDEACQMVRRQTCASRDGGIAGCFVISGFEFSAHVPSVRCVSACGQSVLSDRLLA